MQHSKSTCAFRGILESGVKKRSFTVGHVMPMPCKWRQTWRTHNDALLLALFAWLEVIWKCTAASSIAPTENACHAGDASPARCAREVAIRSGWCWPSSPPTLPTTEIPFIAARPERRIPQPSQWLLLTLDTLLYLVASVPVSPLVSSPGFHSVHDHRHAATPQSSYNSACQQKTAIDCALQRPHVSIRLQARNGVLRQHRALPCPS